jgi:formylglycine-generating enzyme required for sulfatase activity
VEQVSWDDCQAFIGRLNQRLEGLATRLPTEAEWERACRAGTTSATWIGDLTLRGENDAPELDAIAWYGGNSGVDFELDNGVDSSDWPGKQYPHTNKAGTHPVGRKAPNPYGLHDMLGNVFEWCQDAAEDYHSHPYTSEPAEDPVSPGQGSSRVDRGGSWLSSAGYVRAANRGANSRGYCDGYLGFRLAGGQVSAPSKSSRPEREPRSGDPGRGARRDTSRASARDATRPRPKRLPSLAKKKDG